MARKKNKHVRVRGYAKAHGIPVIDCSSEEGKHKIARRSAPGTRRVFISYARENQDKVRSLAEVITGLDHHVWFDEELFGGQTWWDRILSEIRDSDIFLFMLAPESLDSQACKSERTYALTLNKNILPVLISDSVEMELLPKDLRGLHHVDCRTEHNRAFLALNKALKSLKVSPALPDPLPLPPEVPISDVSRLHDQVEDPNSKSLEEQSKLLLELLRASRNRNCSEPVRTLLARFREREDLYAKIAVEIDTVLSAPPSPTVGVRWDSAKPALEPKVLEERRGIAESMPDLPGRDAPSFHLLEESIALMALPCADPMTPWYMLDKHFRIIEWNDAFSLCFDRSMEGQRGLSVLEWVYFLENWKEVLDHGKRVFSNTDTLPTIDKEELVYTSRLYGRVTGIKRAYQIPDDDGKCLGWLITIDPKFQDGATALKFQADLLDCLRRSLMWSEYALSYDKVLMNTRVYPELLDTILGRGQSGPDPIARQSRILDLGAGTGNIETLLVDRSSQRLVVAIDSNWLMLKTLRQKCQQHLRQDAEGAGVIAIKQDISALFGLNDNFFDYAIINNVLYSLEDAAVERCLKETCRVLKQAGEIRISGPQKSTNLSALLEQIKQDLVDKNRFDELQKDFLKVRQINEYSLAPMLLRWSKEDMEALLRATGFSKITYSTDKAYGGQSMLVCARK
jgi:ubiquinone/menaquinone biosynthesis C-methylase UbiE/PAS domain-containing protein